MEDEFGDVVTVDSPPFIYENLKTGAVAPIKPRVFGEAASPYDAPTPRTRKKLVSKGVDPDGG
jgi:hypothetical protein